MTNEMHVPPDDIKHIYSWYKKAQVDYTELYVRLYISYNAWYRQVTATTNDREAISRLKKRFVIWDDYCSGNTLQRLRVYAERLSKLTYEQPLAGSAVWNGVIQTSQDWRSLIEFWYQVRCYLVHGSDVPPKCL